MPRLYDAQKSLLITGGGTGGHVVPAIEIAKAHMRVSSRPVLYAGTPGSLEERLASRAGIPFAPVHAGGIVGKSLSGKISGAYSILRGTGSALRHVSDFRPGLVLGTGGYVQVPVVVAARILGVPIALMEPNRVAGLANRILGPLARRIVYGWATDGGIPLAPDVRRPAPGRERFESRPLKVLVMGGSQGARVLNERLPEILAKSLQQLPGRVVEIIHQSGERWVESTRERYQRRGVPVRVEGFLPEIASLLGNQSLVVARAGAMTVAEITASGTPAIYCPFPHSAGGHQKENARAVEDRGGGWCWEENRLMDIETCAAEISRILSDSALLYGTGLAAWTHSPGVPASEWLLRL
ncbi:MAG: UDP-N-acetylglucosamine--N-acetylmuramyl-(pentapeptide) pyrophosphoryl-undecaprenol N-acetylglucosamine transferase [Leptospirillia bacterium]